jgi:succinyl-diaminopimelate desuccinylase
MIGYPGLEHVVTGSRGVLRARMHVHGVASHSGGSRATPSAIAKAAALITRLHGHAAARAGRSPFSSHQPITGTSSQAGAKPR